MTEEYQNNGDIRISDVYETELSRAQLPRKRGKELMTEEMDPEGEE